MSPEDTVNVFNKLLLLGFLTTCNIYSLVFLLSLVTFITTSFTYPSIKYVVPLILTLDVVSSAIASTSIFS